MLQSDRSTSGAKFGCQHMPPCFLVSFTNQKARTILMYMFYTEHTILKIKLRAISNTGRLRLHALCQTLGYNFFKYLPLIDLGRRSPCTISTIYEFPEITLIILYGPSQLGDHLPNLLLFIPRGKIVFQTRSPT